MTNKEAIEFLKNDGCDECTSGFLTPDTCKIDRCELKCAVEKAVDALKKQLPKMVRVEHGFKDVSFCSSCGRPVCQWQFGDVVNYCFYCGQAIDWGEEDDE